MERNTFGLKPDSRLIIGTVLRELQNTLIPELSSPNAKVIAQLMCQVLRSLEVREDKAPDMLEEWNKTMNEIVLLSGGSIATVENIAANNHHLCGSVEEIVLRSISTSTNGKLEPLSRMAIEAEMRFYDRYQEAVDSVVLPQRNGTTQKQMEMTPEKLGDYFARKLAQFSKIRVISVNPILSGFSKETFLVEMEADDRPLPVVIRRNLRHGPLATKVEDEYPLVKALHERGFQVPKPLLLETDEREFGEAFTVTLRAPGSAAASTMTGIRAGPEMRHAAECLAAFLAKLHNLDLSTLGLPATFYDSSLTTKDYIIKKIDFYQGYYEEHCIKPSPVLAAGLAWVRANVPDIQEPPQLVHGDATLTNILMSGDEMSVMLDWELAMPGDFIQDITFAKSWVTQFMPWEEYLDFYYRHGGRPYHAERENYYSVLSDVIVGCMSTRVIDMQAKSDHPQLADIFITQHYYGHYIRKVASHLLGISE